MALRPSLPEGGAKRSLLRAAATADGMAARARPAVHGAAAAQGVGGGGGGAVGEGGRVAAPAEEVEEDVRAGDGVILLRAVVHAAVGAPSFSGGGQQDGSHTPPPSLSRPQPQRARGEEAPAGEAPRHAELPSLDASLGSNASSTLTLGHVAASAWGGGGRGLWLLAGGAGVSVVNPEP